MKDVSLRFHSLEEAFEFANRPLPAGQLESSRESGDHKGSESWDEFQDLALSRNWEPLQKLREFLANIPANRTARRSEVPGVLSVSRYLAGDQKPCTRRQRGTAKRLRVAAGMSYSAYVSTDEAIRWGVTLIERLAALSAQGVEITADVIDTGKDAYVNGGNTEITFCVPWDDACLLIAHPSSLRRLVFAIMERASTTKVSDGYGIPSKDMPAGYDFTFSSKTRDIQQLRRELTEAFGPAD